MENSDEHNLNNPEDVSIDSDCSYETSSESVSDSDSDSESYSTESSDNPTLKKDPTLNDFVKNDADQIEMDFNEILKKAADPQVMNDAKSKVGEMFGNDPQLGNFFNSIFDCMSQSANQSQNSGDLFANMLKGVMTTFTQMDSEQLNGLMNKMPGSEELKQQMDGGNFEKSMENPLKFEFHKEYSFGANLPKNVNQEKLESEISEKLNSSFNDCMKGFGSEMAKTAMNIKQACATIENETISLDQEYSDENDTNTSSENSDRWSVEGNVDNGDDDDHIKVTI